MRLLCIPARMAGLLFVALLLAFPALTVAEDCICSGAGCAECVPGSHLYWTLPYEQRPAPWSKSPTWALGCEAPPPCDPPSWYASTELLLLYRDIVQSEPTDGIAAPDTRDFAPGVLVTVGRQFAPRYRLEGSYFGHHSWSNTAEVDDELISTNASLDNGEITLRHRIEGLPFAPYEASYLIGLRMMDIDERLSFQEQTTQTSNFLTGLQGGALGQFMLWERTWLDWELKGAIANNDMEASNLGTKNSTSFIGETSVSANYQFLPSVTFRVGYRGIWVTDLALPEENRDSRLISDDGEIAYHGLNVGVVWVR